MWCLPSPVQKRNPHLHIPRVASPPPLRKHERAWRAKKWKLTGAGAVKKPSPWGKNRGQKKGPPFPKPETMPKKKNNRERTQAFVGLRKRGCCVKKPGNPRLLDLLAVRTRKEKNRGSPKQWPPTCFGRTPISHTT